MYRVRVCNSLTFLEFLNMAKEHEISCGIFNEAKTFVKLHLDLTNSVRSWFFIFSKVVNVEKVSDSVGV